MTSMTGKKAPEGGWSPAVEWLVLLAVSGLAAIGLVRAQFGPGHSREIAAGWAVTAVYAAVVAGINRRAVGGSFTRTLIWGLGVKAAGLGGLLAAILLAWKTPGIHLYSFVFAVLLGYVAALAGEVRGLWRMANRCGKARDDPGSNQFGGGRSGSQEYRAAGVHHAPHDELA